MATKILARSEPAEVPLSGFAEHWQAPDGCGGVFSRNGCGIVSFVPSLVRLRRADEILR